MRHIATTIYTSVCQINYMGFHLDFCSKHAPYKVITIIIKGFVFTSVAYCRRLDETHTRSRAATTTAEHGKMIVMKKKINSNSTKTASNSYRNCKA